MTKDDHENVFSLRDIAGWVDNEKSEVKIPDLQRGLVWKPRQMELLWDSMLRGFPIGSFILSEATDGKYFLLDGQQRFNAIATGYGTVPGDRAMLWLDIRPESFNNSSRTFWVKSTTIAHPWGFKNNDECSTLSSGERRKALEEYGMPGRNMYKKGISIQETWPIEARKPVPLTFFLDAPLDCAESFAKYLETRCGKRSSVPYGILDEDDIFVLKDIFYPVFKNLENYTVQYIILPRSVIERESEGKELTEEATPLEILFNRLNTGGTRISQDDLSYSAIKAYWGRIKEKNDSIAKRYMPPSKLVMLAFRLALTQMDESKGLRGPLSIRQIRSLAKDQDADAISLIERIYDQLENIMMKIDSWLNVFNSLSNPDPDGMPAYIRTSIARNSPEVFLLLMYLASEDLNGKLKISSGEIKGMALLLHWFGQDKKAAAGKIFDYIHGGGDSPSLRKGLSECFGSNLLLPVFSAEEMRKFIQVSQDEKWNPSTGNDYAPWLDFYNRISFWKCAEAREMLLYAQRSYINEEFRLYDPAREDMWEEHNRPWDYDHIIPQNWIKERGRSRRRYRDYCDHWAGRIGNIAAIPFEENRSKGDRNSYSVYDKNSEALLFYPEFREISPMGERLTEDPEASYKFATVAFKRTLEIYGRCFSLFSPLLEKTLLSDRQNRRRKMMEEIASHLDNPEIVFVAKGGALWREYPVEREADWSREWISVGVRRKEKYFISFTWGCNDQDHLEIGLRKLPGTDTVKDDLDRPKMDESYWTGVGDWWYAEKGLPSNLGQEAILEELQMLLKKFGDD